ncbi:hypothetical protein PFTANZ_05936, partial [Plasmodium falciparum Tanzania (2000708)]
KCRGKTKGEKYCSLNGFDCTKRIPKGDICSSDSNCTVCSNKCISYDLWLGDQRNEFKIQKDKYDNEIKTYVNKTPISNSNINTEYYKTFYEKFKDKGCKSLDEFLTLLNKGTYCKKGVEGESLIDFRSTLDNIFHRSKYCQPCPDCIVDCTGGNCKEKTEDDNCRSKLIKKILEKEKDTDIDVLHSGDGPGAITEKLHDFCSSTTNYEGPNVQKWKCYNKNSDYNNCEMNISSYKDPTDPNLMVSVECFHSWARNLLIDTIRWEHQLKDCINNTNVTDCKSNCNKNCKCYEKWIKRKEGEWKQVKGVLNKKDETSHNYYDKLKDVFDRFLFPVIYELEKEEKNGKWDQFRKDLEKKFGTSETNTPTGKSQDAIEFLLDHLKDNAITCKDNNSNESCENSKGSKPNPCIRNANSSKPTKTVKHIAELMQQKAHIQLEKRGGESNLKGDATRGEYTKNGKASKFNDICDIKKEHSNSTKKSDGPCYGKDRGRFKIGTEWKTGTNVKMTENEAYMPPRREHMCTSNLEHLETGQSPLKNSDGKVVNNSFLGDVLLAANKEGDFIVGRLKSNGNHLGICNAMKYSFADLGDIIRGRDMWDQEGGMKSVRGHLEKIFGTLHNTLPGIKGKYTGDDPDYKQLREDWWEANRHQVWRAMKCAIEKDNITKCNGIPIEDYIPQRLRWMTEWAEWFCKMQSQEYSKLVAACVDCMNKGQGDGKGCIKNDNECTKCTQACKDYNSKIEPWREQWKKIKNKYEQLYKQAHITAINGGPDASNGLVDDEDKSVIEFLFELYKANGGRI